MSQDPSRIENILTEGSDYSGPYLSRIEKILKGYKPGGGASFDGPYDSLDDLPDPGESGKIYLVSNGSTDDYYDEYYWDPVHDTYNSLGTTKLELEDYAKKDYVDDAIEDAIEGITEATAADAQNDWNAVFGSEFNPTTNVEVPSVTSLDPSDVVYEND